MLTSKTVGLVAPIAVWNGLWVAAFLVYSLRVALRGIPDFGGERHSKVIGRFISHFLFWMIAPLERALVRRRVSPNAITAAAVAIAFGGAVALGAGWFGLGGWLYLATGITDILDGRVARKTCRVSTAGAFADSVADRLAEAAIFGGLAWYFRTGPVMLLVLGVLAASFLVSYTRARGEGLGVKIAEIGAMQRPERIFFLSMTLIHTPFVALFASLEATAAAWPTVVGLVVVGVASLATAIHRFAVVYGLLRCIVRGRPSDSGQPRHPLAEPSREAGLALPGQVSR